MNRKKIYLPWICLLCLLLTACSNAFAEREYDSDEKISQQGDHYSKKGSVSHSKNGDYSLTVSSFNGRQTIWNKHLQKAQTIELDVSFRLSNGQAKLVHIDKEGTVTTIIECSPNTSTDGFVTKTVSLTSGENRLKLVGYDCSDLALDLLFSEP